MAKKYDIDYLSDLKKEVKQIVDVCKNNQEFPDCYHVDDLGLPGEDNYMILKYYDNNEENIWWCISYCNGEMILMQYEYNMEYCLTRDRQLGLFLK